MNDTIWTPQAGPQLDAILATWCTELLFGGAKYGGKSDFLLGDFAQDVHKYGRHWQGILFRKTMPELQEIIRRSREIYPQTGATWYEQPKEWRWPNGAILRLRYLERISDVDRYQGHSYTWIGWDELGQFAEQYAYNMVKSNLRWAEASVPTKRIRATANPGGAGHHWIKSYFIDPAPKGFSTIVDETTKMKRMYIPSRVENNQLGLIRDPEYVNRLRGVGSPELVRAWLEGDWNIFLGSYFPEFCDRHIITPHKLPEEWLKFGSFDWGSYRPFSYGWWAISDGTAIDREGKRCTSKEAIYYPKNALIRFREYYGASEPNTGLKMRTEDVAKEILARTHEELSYSVADPAIFKMDGGPSMYERFRASGLNFRRADNTRIPGWEALRSRLIGEDGVPMIYFFSTCRDSIRTLPALQHDDHRPEDVDSNGEDHCFIADTLVETEFAPQKIIDLVGTEGRIFTIQGALESYRNCRLTQKNAEVVQLKFSDGREVICTPNHKFLVSDRWVPAIDMVDEVCYAIDVWKLRQSARRSKNLTKKGITCVATIFNGRDNGCIERFGSILMAPFRLVSMCITKTITEAIIKLRTWNVLPNQSIYHCTESSPHHGHPANMPYLKQPNGIDRKLGELGMQGTGKNTWLQNLKLKKQNVVKNVGTNTLLQKATPILASFVTPTARPVRCVSVEKLKTKHDVYCLTVPKTEAFAINGGFIVHNCADEIRYSCMSRPWVRELKKDKPQRNINHITLNELWSFENERRRAA